MEHVSRNVSLFFGNIFHNILMVGDVILKHGDKLEHYHGLLSPSRKYMLDVIIRIPLVFAIHQWYCLSPYSDNYIIDIIFFCARHFGALIMFGCWAMRHKNILLIYCLFIINFIMGWLMEACYWMFENEAHQESPTNVWLRNEYMQIFWWILQLTTICMHCVYLACLVKLFNIDEYLWHCCALLCIVLVPQCLCMFGINLSLSYYHFKLLFWVYLLVPLLTKVDTDIQKFDVNGKLIIPPLPGKWFVRDVYASFGFIYFLMIAFVDIAFIKGVNEMISFNYLSKILGTWCTSFAIIMALSSMMAIVSNITVVLSRGFVSGKLNLQEIFAVNIGGRVQLGMTVLCLEASLLTVDAETRIGNMKSVLFLTMYISICQCGYLTENYFLGILNGGKTQTITAFIRVSVFSLALVAGPTIITYYASDWLDISFWVLLNASGNFNLIVRAFLTLIEICLVSVSWHDDNTLDKLEDAIYYARVSKSLSTVLCIMLLSYFRLIAPFFNGSWIIRIPLIFWDAFIVGEMIVAKEWQTHQKRMKSLGNLKSIPDASQEDLTAFDDVCPVCFTTMTSGKKLPCDHVIHENCLRRWCQIRTICPLCYANNSFIPQEQPQPHRPAAKEQSMDDNEELRRRMIVKEKFKRRLIESMQQK